MISDKAKRYLTISLAGAPKVLAALLTNATLEQMDRTVDPERFTLREMLAHLGDWETINLSRLNQLRDDVDPVIQGIDEGEWASTHDHAHADPSKSLADFTVGRAKIIDFIETLTPDDWLKTGHHTEAGPITLAEQLIMISAHDGYHFGQTVDWLKA
jgi:hypothetical protein